MAKRSPSRMLGFFSRECMAKWAKASSKCIISRQFLRRKPHTTLIL
jgi:hypothetical protein